MNCKDCYHYDVCHIRINSIDFLPVIKGKVSLASIMYKECDDVEKHCLHFKDKSRIIELPCKVGDEIYCINGTQTYKAKVHCVSCGGRCSDWQFHIYDCDKDNACVLLKDFKKDWFLTKEEAEAKLKELNEND